jgi:hypothetical protein
MITRYPIYKAGLVSGMDSKYKKEKKNVRKTKHIFFSLALCNI